MFISTLIVLLSSLPVHVALITDPGGEAASAPGAMFESPRALLDAVGRADEATTTLQADIQYTTINALENDMQIRRGKLAIRNEPIGEGGDPTESTRRYAVRFDELLVDARLDEIEEHYVFDGRWFVERYPEEKQFNKHELVPAGETLDPMALMREAPFWVSLGRDQDRLLSGYDATLHAVGDGLAGNEDFPELASLAAQPQMQGTQQLKLVPRPGSEGEDDWEFVRIWFDRETLLPALYIKQDWTGDLQVVQMFNATREAEVPAGVFDTSTPDATSGWRVQINRWRGED